MKFEHFTSGVYRQQLQYKSFLPTTVNREWTWEDSRINVLLEKATRSLSELNGLTLIVPDIDLFVRMHIIREANMSSRIEGTKTELDEAILEEEEIRPERRDDWREVQNYVRAMNNAIEELDKLPLSLRLLKHTHAILMEGVRGKHKTPGEFRRSQNWIGGSSLMDAAFIPPHHIDIPDLLSDLESFWHNDQIYVPHLVRIAISHYHFETIHPFLDGNGRIGRLLITLYLVYYKLLYKPSLYLSAYLEKHRHKYYDALTRVRESNDIGHWVRFFLQAVIETAENGKNTFLKIRDLKREMDDKVVTLGRRAENARKLINHLYRNPAVTVKETCDILQSQYQTANNLISVLVETGILEEMTGFRRNRIFLFRRYLELFQQGIDNTLLD